MSVASSPPLDPATIDLEDQDLVYEEREQFTKVQN